MKRSKISRLSVIALVLGMVASAFTSSSTGVVKNDGPFFYKYTSALTTQLAIQTSANYVRAAQSCNGTTHVCGVFLPTDTGIGQPPVQAEFNVEQGDLWASEQAHQSQDHSKIIMKN